MIDVLKRNLRPSDLITKASLENAIAAVTSSGGSTNGVLHLLAVAKEAGIELDIDDFDRISDRTPLLCDLSPGGKYNATDMFRAGGTALLAQRLKELGILNEDAPTVLGKTVGELADEAQEERASGWSARSTSRSSRPAAWRSCAATSRPMAAS